MHIQIHGVVPVLMCFGLVKCDTVWRFTVKLSFSQSCAYNADYNMRRHRGEAQSRDGHAMLVVCRRVSAKQEPPRVVVHLSHHASSSERSSLLSLSRSRCRWMARQMRQWTPPRRRRQWRSSLVTSLRTSVSVYSSSTNLSMV